MEHSENSSFYKALSVNVGVESPPIVNPYLKRGCYCRKNISASDMVEGILSGNVSMLSRAITLIESTNSDDYFLSQEVIKCCLPFSGKSIRIGISGVPGCGKSTSIDSFGMHILGEYGGKLAVLAIDPSSVCGKGSILGDKTRMEHLSSHPDSFIRPSPTSGSLGGVGRKTRESIILCEAAGYDKIFVETVGVGQCETVCSSMVDFFLLIQLSGLGDELQGIKRGVMEVCDGIVINKSDGDNILNCERTATELRNVLKFFPVSRSGWSPEVLCYSGFYGIGVKQVIEMVYRYIDFVKSTGYFYCRRREQNKYWLYEAIEDGLRSHFYSNAEVMRKLSASEQRVLRGEELSFTVACELLDEYFSSLRRKD